jgi:serine/threonine-protein kinase PpkA
VRTIAGYEVLEQLGRGRYSTVYRARHLRSKREVALKVLDSGLTPDSLGAHRFLAETRVAANLDHPNIVAIHEFGTDQKVVYLALELCRGRSLTAALAKPITADRALRFARDLACALQYAHARGVLHRDLRPDNILLRDDGAAVLGEFVGCHALGLASDCVERLMRANLMPYDSPESTAQQELDARSDLYGLGVVLYRMLSGTLPYAEADLLSLAMAKMTRDAAPLPRALARYQPLIDSLMARAPAARARSAEDVLRLIDDLQRRGLA